MLHNKLSETFYICDFQLATRRGHSNMIFLISIDDV